MAMSAEYRSKFVAFTCSGASRYELKHFEWGLKLKKFIQILQNITVSKGIMFFHMKSRAFLPKGIA